MGLRGEQFNINNLMEYFVSRNEFSREALVTVLEHLTADELTKLQVSKNSLDLTTVYENVRKMIQEAVLETDGSSSIQINQVTIDKTLDENGSPKDQCTLYANSYYYKDYVLRIAEEYVLKLRGITYTKYHDRDMMYKLIEQSNPTIVTNRIDSNDQITLVSDLSADYSYLDKDVLERVAIADILTARDIEFYSTETNDELMVKLLSSNPAMFNNALYNDTNLSSESYYDTDFLDYYGMRVLLTLMGLQFDEDTSDDAILSMFLKFQGQPSDYQYYNMIPLTTESYYDLDFIKKYAYLKVLDSRGILDISMSDLEGNNPTEDSDTDIPITNPEIPTLNKLQLLAVQTNGTVYTKDYMSLKEVCDSIDNDPTFYDTVTTKINEVADSITATRDYVDERDEYYFGLASDEIARIQEDFIDTEFTSYLEWTKSMFASVNKEFSEFKEILEDSNFIIRKGTTNFIGNGFSNSIAHLLGYTPSLVLVNPNEPTYGSLGEYWVTYDDTKLNVFSSGTSTAEFNWLVMYTKDEEKLPIHTGETRFYGNCVELKIPHKCEKLPDFVYIIPTENPENNLGEFYFKYDDTYIYVYNTGDATTKFRWFAYNKSEEDASLNLTRYFTANNNPTVIKHGVDTNIPYIVSVIPDLTSAEITDIDCTVGEVSVKVDETSIYVYNTGSYSGKFKLLMVNPESMISLEKYLKYEPNGDHNVNGYFDKGYHEPTGTQRLNYSGKFSSTVLKATQDGHAEYFTVITPDDDADQSGIFDGAIVGIDSSSVSYDDVTNKLKLVKCGTGDNYIPVGIVNSDAGVLYGHEADNRYPVSFDGIVKIKIAEDESTGKYVNISDYLYGFGTLSDVKSDKTIGYALSERDTTNNVLALIIHNL